MPSEPYDEEQKAHKIDDIQLTGKQVLDERFKQLFLKLGQVSALQEKLVAAVQDMDARITRNEAAARSLEQERDVHGRDQREKERELDKKLERLNGMVNACYADLAALRDASHPLNLTGTVYLGKREKPGGSSRSRDTLDYDSIPAAQPVSAKGKPGSTYSFS